MFEAADLTGIYARVSVAEFRFRRGDSTFIERSHCLWRGTLVNEELGVRTAHQCPG